ncbi:MAG TPA: DUF6580 family putative transport protein, partial [Chitinophagaceae bacterium]|nr:DUF6580 family putative transport protein [Chitinophagaceae bacterium]
MKRNYTNILLAGGLILMAAITRIAGYEMGVYNLASVAALGLFSGNVLKDKKLAYLLPLLAMFTADAYIQYMHVAFGRSMKGFYDISQFFVYGAMVIITFMGTKMKDRKVLRIAGYS